MSLKITGAKSYGPGCAWLETSAALPADVTFRLSCSNSQKPHVGPHGWQSAPYEWRPRKLVSTPGGARLLVGPEIVDQMQEDMLARIEIPATGYVAEGIWPDIPVSAVRHQARLDKSLGPSELPPLPTLGSDELDRVVPAQAAGLQDQQQSLGPLRSSTRRAELLRPFEERLAAHRLNPAKTAATAALWAGLAFVLFAGVGYAYVDSRAAPAVAPDAALGAQTQEALGLLLRAERQPDELFSLGLQLHRAQGASRDVGLQAVQRAAEYDHVPALLWLGRAADPSRGEWKTVARAANPARALVAYGKAARAGSAEARQASNLLCDWLRRQGAPTGDAQASGFC